MKTVTINLFKFNELSETAKERVRSEWREHDSFDAWDSEWQATMEEFCKICGIEVHNWKVSEWMYDYRIRYDDYHPIYEVYDKNNDVWESVYDEELSGKLLFRYVNNNIIPRLMKGKYHSVWYTDENSKQTYKKRRSKVVIETEPEKGTCPMTGYCGDCDVIEPLMKYYRNWAKYPDDYTFADLMEECIDALFKAWQNDIEWQMSDECVDENIESNWGDNWYDENGKEFAA